MKMTKEVKAAAERIAKKHGVSVKEVITRIEAAVKSPAVGHTDLFLP